MDCSKAVEILPLTYDADNTACLIRIPVLEGGGLPPLYESAGKPAHSKLYGSNRPG